MVANKVREFTSVCNDDLPTRPILLDHDKLSFIKDMVNSEFNEIADSINDESLSKEEKIIAQYDGIIDVLYYLGDFCVRNAHNVDEVFEDVHRANMRKIVDGKVIKNERGKVLKPENWFGPEEDMKKTIKKHLKEGSWS